MTSLRYDTDVDQQSSGSGGELDEAQVVQFLLDNPDVLNANPQVIQAAAAGLNNARVTGLESLTLRQMLNLREENRRLTDLTDSLLETGEDYEKKFAWLNAVTLELMDVASLQELNEVIGGEHMGVPHVDHSVLWVKSSKSKEALSHIRFLTDDDDFNARLLSAKQPVAEACREHEYAELFGVEIEAPASLAVIPVRSEKTHALMVFGSLDPIRFSVSSGVIFLEFLSDVLAHVIDRVG